MNVLIKILNAIAKEHWPKLLYPLFVTLAVAVICPIIIAITGLDGGKAITEPSGGKTMIYVKIILAIAILSPILRPLYVYRSAGSGPRALAQWWYSAIPVMIISAIILVLGVSEDTRPIGVALGLIINTVALLIIGVYAFSTRFLYAALIEAPTSADVDVADSEVNAKKVFRVILAILAWEWAAAWFFVTFSPQLTPAMGIIAILSLGIIVFTSYSLGLSGDTGQRILMYGAIATFMIICLVLIDRAIQNKQVSQFFLGGYIGNSLKNPMSSGAIGIVAWITILVFIDLTGTTISWALQEKVKNKEIRTFTLVIDVTLVVYLVGNWIISKKFSMEESIEKLLSHMDNSAAVTQLPEDIRILLILGAVVGTIASCATAINCIRKTNIPVRSIAVFTFCALILYYFVFRQV